MTKSGGPPVCFPFGGSLADLFFTSAASSTDVRFPSLLPSCLCDQKSKTSFRHYDVAQSQLPASANGWVEIGERVLKSFMMTRQFVGSSGKWSDRVVCVVSMQPAKWGKQHEQQVKRITTFRLEQSCREVNNMILPGSCKRHPPNDEMT